jgi:hypothetical protein
VGARIDGRVTDVRTREALTAVTVVATCDAPQATESAVTDERGRYEIEDLEPGTYNVTFYFGDITLRTSAAVKNSMRTTVDSQLDQSNWSESGVKGVPIPLAPPRPTIVPLSTTP